MTKILSADTEELLAKARGLFLEYATSLGFDFGFQDFQKEMADFPDEYSSPRGCLLLALCDDERVLSNGICEMKRLYVKPAFRGLKVERALAEAIIKAGKDLGYSHMRLDTVPYMKEAISLYGSLGFKEIESYRYNPIEGATYMELALD
jgi:ribosomal protein S18 acetylase RimI-like enzyme